MNQDFCFIIPSYCDDELHVFQLQRCISSIRRFHPENKIFIIDDFSKANIHELFQNDKNIEIILSSSKGAGDMVTYYFFLNNKSHQKAVIMQDSMCLENKLENIDKINTISYLWHFTNHRLHWSLILESPTEYNLNNKIFSHDDLIVDCIKKFIHKPGFKKFCQDIYYQKDKWSGCFGCLSIIDFDFLNLLQEKTDIVNILSHMNNNRLRRAGESLFSLACTFVLNDEIFEKSYDGLYYDGINVPNNRKYFSSREIGYTGNEIEIEQSCKNKFFSKISFKRNL